METTLTILLIVVSISTLILVTIMIAVFVGIMKLTKTIQKIAELAQDGTKTAADMMHEVKEKILNPMTMSAIFAQIFKATAGRGKKRR